MSWSAIRAAEAAARLPDEVKAEFRGEAKEAAGSGARQMLLFPTALIAIYIALGVLYESTIPAHNPVGLAADRVRRAAGAMGD